MMKPRIAIVDGKETLVDIRSAMDYPEVMTGRFGIVYLNGITGREHLAGASDYLEALDFYGHDKIIMMIDSPGGDLDDTFTLYDTIKRMRTPVVTIGKYCLSAAAIILAAGNKRYLSPHAKVMLHLGSQFFAQNTNIASQDMEIINKQTLKYKEKIIDILIECGVTQTRKRILRDIDRDFWLEPQEAIEYGLADEIFTKEIWQGMVGDG